MNPFRKQKKNVPIAEAVPSKNNKKKCHQLQKSHANKCYSCEHELPRDKLYQSQKTKCFSCEQDLKKRFGPKMAFFGQPSKCFDCEAQLK